MKKNRIQKIVSEYMFFSEGASYMAGLERRPILAKSKGRKYIDTIGKEYIDFQSGQMGAALGHQHPRMGKRINETLKLMMHTTNTMLNV